MNTKSIEISPKPINKAVKRENSPKRENSDFRDVLNQETKTQNKTKEPELEIPKKDDPKEIELSDSEAISIVAAMQPQAKPEIQMVKVEDGKISIPVMENAAMSTPLNVSETNQAETVAQFGENKTLEQPKTVTKADISEIGQTKQKPEVKSLETSNTKENKNSSEASEAVNKEAKPDTAKALEKFVSKNNTEKSASDQDDILPKNLEMAPKVKQNDSQEVIKVKVGDAQKAGSAEFTREIAKNIDIVNNGKNSYELQLDPANLGKIKVNISFEQGQTNISLTCSNPKTAGLLAENASMLSQIIQNNSGTTALVNVQEESGYLNQEKGENHNQQGRQQNQNQRNDDTEDFADQMKLGLWEIENLKRQYQMSQTS